MEDDFNEITKGSITSTAITDCSHRDHVAGVTLYTSRVVLVPLMIISQGPGEQVSSILE